MTFTFLRPVRNAKIGPNALDGNAADGFIVIDASVSEEHSASWALTSHPVPDGIDITDHKRRAPRVVKMSCIISNSPVSTGVSQLSDLTALDEIGEGFDANITSLRASGTLARTERDTNAWEQLKAYADGNELLDIYTTLESYTNMQISEISTVRNVQTGDSLHFDVTLQEIRKATEKTAESLQVRTGRPAVTNQARKGKKPRPANNRALVDLGAKIGGV